LTATVTRWTTGFPYLDDAPAVLASAHRGGVTPGTESVENSLAAFEAAHAMGYRYLETDVHVTSDGVVVAFHDSSLDRTCGIPGAIRDLTYEQVSRARIADREPIPRLSDLLSALPDARFNIDVKDDAAVEPLARLIVDHSAESRVLVGSFSAPRLRAFRALAGPAVATAAHPREVAAFALLPHVVARRVNRSQALQIPHRERGLTIASSRLIRSAHRAGIPVHVWTINDRREMEILLERGVDGIVTDEIGLLRDVLIDRGQWPSTSEEGR
jgi:glycerophosphoryl diester phosphodiesterase